MKKNQKKLIISDWLWVWNKRGRGCEERMRTSSPLYCFRQLSSWCVLESQKDSSSKSFW